MPAKKQTKKTNTQPKQEIKETAQTIEETVSETIQEQPAQKVVAEEKETVTAQTKGSADTTVTVLMNYPQDIIFRVNDANGIERQLRLKGNATDLLANSNGREIVLPVGKYGITRNVDRELWEAVKAKYRQMPMFENKIIFELGSKEDAEKIAEEYRQVRNGYEPVDPASLAEDFYKGR